MYKTTFGPRIHYVLILSLIFLTLSAWTGGNIYAQVSITEDSKIDASCPSSSDGSISISVQGGSTPYTYEWDGPGTYRSTSQDISGLIAGSYTVTVTDNTTPTPQSNSETFTIIDTDNIDPTISAPADVQENTDSNDCNASSVTLGTPNTNDNCGITSVNNNAPTDFPLGSTTVTWTVTDNSGNTATATQEIIVSDKTNPTITAPADVQANTDTNDCNASNVTLGTPNTNDNCGIASVTNNAPSDFPLGSTTVTWTVTDNSGNTATATQEVIVMDKTNPTITAPADVQANTDTNDCNASNVTLGTPNTNDNCGIASVTNNAPSDFPLGSTTVTWTVTDNSGNTATATQEVIVMDKINPTITAPADASANTSDDNSGDCTTTVSLGNPSTDDNCGVDNVKAFVDGNEIDPATFTFPIGNTTVTWIVTDNNARTASDTQIVSVTDDEDPTITAPADASANTSDDNSGDCTTTVSLGNPSTDDNCGVDHVKAFVDGNEIDPATFTFPIGNTTVTWTVTDNNARTASETQIVSVTDNEDPTITAPADATANTSDDNSGDCTTTVSLGNPSTDDNCGVDHVKAFVDGNEIDPATFTFPIGNTTVTWIVTDNNARTASDTQIVSVTDNEDPTITAPADATANTSDDNSGDCTTTVSLGNPSTDDNCGVDHVKAFVDGNEIDPATFTFPIGNTTVTWIVTDNNARTASDTQIVSITDDEDPTITCVGDKTRNADNGVCYYTVEGSEFDPTMKNDNCEISSIINNFNSSSTLEGEQIPDGTTIEWTLTDNNSNITTCSFLITVNDTQAPDIPVLEPITSECTITITPPITTDNCDTSITGETGIDLTISESTTVIWIFTDSSGNPTETVEQVVTIEDTQAPVANSDSLLKKTITGCQISNISELDIPTATDACDGLIQGTLSDDFQFPYSFYGTNTVTWEYIDESGNISTQQQEIQLNPVAIEGGTLRGTFNGTEFEEQIDISSCGANITVDLNLSGKSGNIIQWEKFAVNKGFWEIINNTSTSYTANFAAGAFESTYFRVLVKNGTCTEYSNSYFVRALPAGDAPTVTNLDESNKYCLGDDVNLLAESNYLATQPAIPAASPGDFNEGQLNTQDPDGWLTDGQPGGFTAGGNSKKPRNWSGTNDHEFGGIEYDGQDKKFAIAQGNFSDNDYKGNIPTTLETPILDLTNAASASLDFDQAFYFANNDIAIIEISTDGGNSYSILKVMHSASSGVLMWFTAGTAESTAGSNSTNYNFNTDNTSISLDEYIGESEVRIRWSFTGTSDKSVWAMDNIFVNNQVPVETELEWTNGIGDPDESPIERGETSIPISFVPQTPGIHEYGATALINGCRTYDEDGTDLIELLVSYSYAGEDIIQDDANCGNNTVQLNAYDNTLTANENAVKKAYPTIPDNCKTCDLPGTGDIGTWSWAGDTPDCTEASFSDVNDANATFSAGPGTYTLTWTVDGCSNEITVVIENCKQVDFDGIDDHVDFGNNYNLGNTFSLEVWIKPESISGTQTIFSKRDAGFSDSAKGYDLRIVNGKVSFFWDKSGSISSTHELPNANRWYHVALTHSSSGEYRLYIDGILMKLTGGGAPTQNNISTLLGAMENISESKTTNFFNGWMEELRIWNVTLTEDQIHQMMNQHIMKSSTGKVVGEIIPTVINNLSWSSLIAYYRMDNISCGNLNAYSSDGTNFKGISGKLRNINSPQQTTAPLPYESKTDGSWDNMDTWLHPDVWDAPNSNGIDKITPINWNIVVTNHDIYSSERNISLLGLLSESGKLELIGSVDMTTGKGSGNELYISHYLKLDGEIDLNGESQLVQPEGSILENTSKGTIDIDQQGTANSFNYNYWTSPVSLKEENNNTGFILNQILYDGSSPNAVNPEKIIFESGYRAADYSYTGTRKISSYWLHTFSGDADDYFEWLHFDADYSLDPGIGFSMKGTSGASDLNNSQNYIFRGKPHNGDISVKVGVDQNLLTGNPYPSAIDSEKFINDNAIQKQNFNGSLYFWDHFGKEDSHYLEEYIGGYAVLNKSGSVSSASSIDSRINTDTDLKGSKRPGKYIPIGQGFFISTTLISNPDSIRFHNSQRVFVKEKNEVSVFHSQENLEDKKKQKKSEYTKDSRYKIRLKFESPKGYHRQILVTADANASGGFDLGYDAPLIENNVEDMYWMIDETEFVIQAVPNFNLDQVLPLGIKLSEEGEYTIKIDELENIKTDFNIYLKDNLNDTYTNLSKEDYITTAEELGYFNERYEIVFKKQVAEKPIEEIPEELEEPQLGLNYLRNTDEIAVLNPDLLQVDHVELYSISGQLIKSFQEVPTERSILLSIDQKLSSAVYIVKMYSGEKVYSRKVIITK